VLSGYGASLDIKKADYLAIDDRLVENNDNLTNAEGPASYAPEDAIGPFGREDEATSLELIPVTSSEVQGA
jgi:hypothetical protein